MILIILSFLIPLLASEYVRRRLIRLTRPPLPPGPAGKLIIGNLFDLPGKDVLQHVYFANLKSLYGPISSLTIFGTTLVIVNTANLANDLLNKQSAQTSGRPHGEFALEMVNLKQFMPLTPDNAFFKAQRKAMHREIGTKAALRKTHHVQEVEVARLLLRTLDRPDALMKHVQTEAGAMILKLAYGYTVEPRCLDPLVELAERVVGRFFFAMKPGAWFVDTLPVLKHLPDWFPGTGFKQIAKDWKADAEAFATKPFELVKKTIAYRKRTESYTASLLKGQAIKPGSYEEDVIKWSAAAMYGGGSDSTAASLQSFFLAMILNPEVQRKAQEELDTVVGDRLPSWNDRAKLPYVDAVVKEVLRWHPVAVMAIPHVTTEETDCAGYRIPKGAQIIPNIWAITHDETIYADPHTFNPSRFLTSNTHIPEQDPASFVFGFGRRICPGRALADENLFLNIASFLAVYSLGPAVRDGKDVPAAAEFTPGLISHPMPYGFRVEPRSEDHAARVRELEEKFPWEESHAKEL